MELTQKSSLAVALALGAVVIAMLVTLLSVSPSTAQAGENHYCWGNWVAGKNFCFSDNRWFNAEFGQGQQGSVCVGNANYTSSACSGGPAPQTVYHPEGTMMYTQAWIYNNLYSNNNQVYGITFTP